MKQLNAVGFDSASRSWMTKSPGRAGAKLPRLDGALRIDEQSLAEAGEDFGHLRRTHPLAVLEPGSEEDVVRMVRFARQHGLKIGPRGQGHTAFGQSQVEGGIVIRMTALQAAPFFGSDRVEVGAGMSWRRVLTASLAHGLKPPVLTHNLSLSVGGTLSVGGIDGGSYRYGAQVDNVLALTVVTGEGKVETCSQDQLPELFEAVLAGQGQCGIILRAVLRLIPAQTHTLFFQLLYPDLSTMLSDERMLIADGRFDKISVHILPSAAGGWTYFAQARRDFTPPALPVQEVLLAGLQHVRGFERMASQTYLESADRGAKHFAELTASGRVRHPHPWFDMFVPDSTLDEYAAEIFSILKPSEITSDFPIEFYGFNTAVCRRPLFRVPDEPVAFLNDVMITVPDPEAAMRMYERNRRFFERARQLGGKHYPIGAIPLSPEDWQQHFDPYWEQFASAKRRFDPDRILAPGVGIF
jgi:FAD/FMN-containing dehydrogenase